MRDFPALAQRPESFGLYSGHPLYQGLLFAALGQHSGGTLYHDESPRSAHGVLGNFTGAGNTPADRWAQSTLGRRSLQFTRTSSTKATATPGISGQFANLTVALWVKLPEFFPDTQLISQDSSSFGRCLIFQMDGTGHAMLLVWSVADGIDIVTASTACSLNTWTHIAGTYQYVTNGTSIQKVWVNGILSGTNSACPGPPKATATGPLTIGYRDYAGSEGYMGATIADPMAWSRVLTTEEITALANPGNVDLRLSGVPLILPLRRSRNANSFTSPAAINFLLLQTLEG